jgi:hypothetical protein
MNYLENNTIFNFENKDFIYNVEEITSNEFNFGKESKKTYLELTVLTAEDWAIVANYFIELKEDPTAWSLKQYDGDFSRPELIPEKVQDFISKVSSKYYWMLPLIDNYWTDENNNRWYFRNYTQTEAASNSKYMENCTNCTDCSSCSDCHNCTDCQDCKNCNNCRDCYNLVNSEDCTHSDNCNNCQGCEYCSYCNDCANCESIENKYIIRSRESGDEIERFQSLEEAEKTIAEYELEDKENNCFTPDFYEIYSLYRKEIIQ